MNFIIFSLPRSGSAWLSNFLTYEDVFCYHEPLADHNLCPDRAAPITGFCDTHAYTFPVVADLEFVLLRDIEQIRNSLSLANLPFIDDVDSFRRRTLNAYPIEYSKLFNVDYLRDIWYNISTSPFNAKRAEMLIEMNVQRDFGALLQRVRRAYF